MNMLAKVLLGLATVLVTLGIYLVFRAIKQRCCESTADLEGATVNDPLISKDFSIGETLKRPSLGLRKETARIDSTGSIVSREVPAYSLSAEGDAGLQDVSISLEVIAGPSAGLRLSKKLQAKRTTSISVGRIPQNDLVLTDSEVSGKHALISWNQEVSRWELVDMGSLNGTLVNSISVSGPGRRRSAPVGLTNGDVLTLGSTSQVLVQISGSRKGSRFSVSAVPFGVGVAADSMTVRREKLAMEDVCLCEWPLRGFEQFGIFCIFDGHGGVGAAEAACRVLPQKLSNILAADGERSRILTQGDASKALRDAFRQTEECLDCEYEGCTATVLLLWSPVSHEFFVQCANVGDSACVLSLGGKHMLLTQDHRLTSPSERSRLMEMGKSLKDGDTRLCGMNIARALGDKYLKEEESCFSAEPYVSNVVKIARDSRAMLVMASDGLWDVLSPYRAIQIALECRDGRSSIDNYALVNAEGISQLLLQNARLLKTKDNTTVIVLDFSTLTTSSSHFGTL